MKKKIKRLPDDMNSVIKNIKARLSDFDPESVKYNLKKYGNSFARRVLGYHRLGN